MKNSVEGLESKGERNFLASRTNDKDIQSIK